jgi:hypothetical protein
MQYIVYGNCCEDLILENSYYVYRDTEYIGDGIFTDDFIHGNCFLTTTRGLTTVFAGIDYWERQ